MEAARNVVSECKEGEDGASEVFVVVGGATFVGDEEVGISSEWGRWPFARFADAMGADVVAEDECGSGREVDVAVLPLGRSDVCCGGDVATLASSFDGEEEEGGLTLVVDEGA